MKQCNKCQAEIKEGDKFCTSCGAPVEEAPVATEPATAETAEPAAEPAAAAEEKPIFGASEPKNVSPADTIGAVPAATPVMGTAPAKKNNTMTFMIIGMVVCLLLAIGGVVFAIVAGSKNNEKTARRSEEVSTTDGGNTATPASSNTGTRVSLDGREIVVPSDYDYQIEDGMLMLVDRAETHAYMLYYFDAITFSSLSNNVAEYEKEVSASGEYLSVKAGTTTVKGTDVVYMDLQDMDGDYYSDIFVKSGLYSYEVIVVNSDYEIDHSLFDRIVEILSSSSEQTASKALDAETSLLNGFKMNGGELGL